MSEHGHDGNAEPGDAHDAAREEACGSAADRGTDPAADPVTDPAADPATDGRPESAPGGDGVSLGALVESVLAGSVLPDLPVLAEVPELAGLLGRLRLVDRLLAEAVQTLILLEDTSLAEEATGVAVEQWMAIVGRRTRSDRRMLSTAATACRRLPSLRAGFADGRVSWAQVRAVALKVERQPRHLDDRIDDELARAVDEAAGADPDALSRVVGWVLSSLEEAESTDPTPRRPDDFLHLQPRLDGTGGSFYGEAGPEGFALLDACLDTAAPAPDVAPMRDHLGGRRDDQRAEEAARVTGAQRLARLLGLIRRGAGAGPVTGDDGPGAGDHAPVAGDHAPGSGGDARDPAEAPGPPPLVILRAELETLLGGSRPGQLLTHLAGGRMHVDAAAARRIAQVDGAHVRLVVTDGGKIVGVGRRQRHAPDWMREGLLALHDTCTTLGCETAARVCETDHAHPWERGGTTDVANCAPMCSHDNAHKDREGWRVAGRPDGDRTWHHPRSGLTVRTMPATWRPAGEPPDHRGRRRPPRAGPDRRRASNGDPPSPPAGSDETATRVERSDRDRGP